MSLHVCWVLCFPLLTCFVFKNSGMNKPSLIRGNQGHCLMASWRTCPRMDRENCSSQTTMGTYLSQATEIPSIQHGAKQRGIQGWSPAHCHQHHLGLLRLVSSIPGLRPHLQPWLSKEWALKKSILVDVPSFWFLILRYVPTLKTENLRTFTVETKLMG